MRLQCFCSLFINVLKVVMVSSYYLSKIGKCNVTVVVILDFLPNGAGQPFTFVAE